MLHQLSMRHNRLQGFGITDKSSVRKLPARNQPDIISLQQNSQATGSPELQTDACTENSCFLLYSSGAQAAAHLLKRHALQEAFVHNMQQNALLSTNILNPYPPHLNCLMPDDTNCRVESPGKDTAGNHRKGLAKLQCKVHNAVCGLVRMQPKYKGAVLKLLSHMPLLPDVWRELNL